MKNETLLLVIAALMLPGCASNYIRVTEYAGSTLPIPGTNAAAGGCMISQEGEAPQGELTYEGEKCTFTTTPAAAE